MKSIFAGLSLALALLLPSCSQTEEVKPLEKPKASSARFIEYDPSCGAVPTDVYDLDFPLDPLGPNFPFYVSSYDEDAWVRFKIEPLTSVYDPTGSYGNWFYMNTAYGGEYTPSHQYIRFYAPWPSSLLYKSASYASQTWEYKLTIQYWRSQSACAGKEKAWKLKVDSQNQKSITPLY